MKAESWKKIIDDLDDDIVDSAAERLSKPEHFTVDDVEAFTQKRLLTMESPQNTNTLPKERSTAGCISESARRLPLRRWRDSCC